MCELFTRSEMESKRDSRTRRLRKKNLTDFSKVVDKQETLGGEPHLRAK